MRKIRFGRTNVQVPAISLGTWGHGGPRVNEGASVGWSGHDDNLARAALVAAYRAGITHWDTADAYGDGHAEILIGEALKEVPREAIFIATKFGWIKGPAGHWYDPAFMRAQCERSLRNMGIETIDLYYFHHCMFGENDEYLDGALEMMHRLREEGKVRFVGLSDWQAGRIMRFIDRVDPDVVQPFRNLLDDEVESSGLAGRVRSNDLGLAFFSPLKHGLLLGKYREPHDFPKGDFRSSIREFRDAEALARIARAADATRERFRDRPEPVLGAVTGALLAGNPTATVLLGMRNPEQVEAATHAGQEVTAEEADWLRGMYRGGVEN